MRLGCFVIHGNSADTLGDALDDLVAVGDRVVAVDSGSNDGSAELVRARGVRPIRLDWQGYGAARAAAAAALKDCDYLFFLDADERLAPGGRAALQDWKGSNPHQLYYRLRRRDWADLPEGRFLFRSEWKKRLIRGDAATWAPAMIVHEALPSSPDTGTVSAVVDHRYTTSLDLRLEKEERYALLWAVQAHCRGRKSRWSGASQPAHWVRNALIKGALFRAGSSGARLSWAVARAHRRKYEILRDLEQGQHAALVDAYRREAFGELFRLTLPGTTA